MDNTKSKTFYRDAMELTKEESDKIDTLAAAFGFGPKYKPTPAKKYTCPKCKKENAVHKEMHADTDMNEIVLSCPDCGFEEEV